MTCTRNLWGDSTGLPCVRTDPHDEGHSYTSGSQPQDGHHDTEARQEDQL